MAYKEGRSEKNSPTYKEGCADGLRDTELMSACPGNAPLGPQQSGAMYMRGYNRTFVPGFHVPCPGCRRAS